MLDVAAAPPTCHPHLRVGVGRTGQVWLTDINNACSRSAATACSTRACCPVAQCDAEKLPFSDDHFDIVTVAFGLRNMTHKDRALTEMRRVLRRRPGCWCSSFPGLEAAGKFYTTPIPSTRCPGWAARSSATRSPTATWPNRSACIPTQATLKSMMEKPVRKRVDVFNLTAGVVALHRGYKL